MAADSHSGLHRREFLKLAAAAAAIGVTEKTHATRRSKIGIVIDHDDPISSNESVLWAAEELHRALTAKGATTETLGDLEQMDGRSFLIVVASETSKVATAFPQSSSQLNRAESVRWTPGKLSGTSALLISAIDARGYVYGLLEIAERVQFSSDALPGLMFDRTVGENGANKVRSVARAFCSEIEDKAWFYDREFWRRYLDLLAYSRFNRFNFALGFGYDFPRGVTGDYFHFPYPYLVNVPGYQVRVVPLADGERERNLEMLRFIAAETALRGIQFQLGIWSHAYEWTDSPHADHHIEGLTAETHAPYCRDALAMLLRACPQIQGLTLRVHGESGIPEGSYPFWKTLFEAISGCGRRIEIDMHAKGINQIMIDMATATGMPVRISPKYSAEHMGLGYHQADIRELEIPRADRMETGVFSVSNGERRFTRYGYADLFQEGRAYDVLFRLWPGTQRHLLWGDPEMAAAYGRTAHFCGASGLELCEPLTFKGREGSGQPGGRCAYADEPLRPKVGDWNKFEYTYRLWGRLLYNPDSSAEIWQRYLRSKFGTASASVEAAVTHASRILPLVTTAHLASASNHAYWPEIYDNMSIVLGSEPSPYGDTPDPKRFGTVSPLDPQLFSSIAEHAQDIIGSQRSAKYSPIEVAQWLEHSVATSNKALVAARKQAVPRSSVEFRRMEEDVLIQNGLGTFFAAKLRSGVLFEIYLHTGSAEAGRLALSEYQKARTAWEAMAKRASTIYRSDIAYGSIPMRRGDWSKRVAAIDRDIAAMDAKVKGASGSAPDAGPAIRAITEMYLRPAVNCSHTMPVSFRPGQPLSVELDFSSISDVPSAARLHYRHVNQGERWLSLPMKLRQQTYGAAIPAAYTNSVYPLQYYFELERKDAAWLYPSFNESLSNQPYYAVWQRTV